ncbi:MAG: ribosome small subunit-dependent GTPase A [Magnetococcales bacterium]|nr:ribosome small subunit-dependent GTPase A [Magnetococcales bacterium]
MSNAFSTLSNAGLRPFFQQQLTLDDLTECHLVRVIGRHGDWLTLTNGDEQSRLKLPGKWRQRSPEEQPIIGDWLLLDQEGRPDRLLERSSHLARRASGHGRQSQSMVANVDTLFIVSSCNRDFNLSRLERYLALAHEGGVQPIILLTKADLVTDPDAYLRQTAQLRGCMDVITLDARSAESEQLLEPWIGAGETVALLGSSGVGKSTLMNTLQGCTITATQPIRDDDDKGRHTTTSRIMVRMASGAWLIDTPGIRELRLGETQQGFEEVFADIEQLAERCRFRDCDHEATAGCAVQAAIEAGELEARRLNNYLKLQREQGYLKETVRQQRDRERRFSKMINEVKTIKYGHR